MGRSGELVSGVGMVSVLERCRVWGLGQRLLPASPQAWWRGPAEETKEGERSPPPRIHAGTTASTRSRLPGKGRVGHFRVPHLQRNKEKSARG